MVSVETAPTEYELSPSAEILARRFIQRWDKYPKQLRNGMWISIPEPLHVDLLFAHLQGKLTLGTYLLNPDSQGRFLVLDADTEAEWQQLKQTAEVLAEQECPSYREASRRGGHLWFFFSDWLPGYRIREFASGLLAVYQVGGVEIYPKQDVLTEGPGSLIRLPFGLHQLTQQRYGFYDNQGDLLAGSARSQLRQLASALTVPKTAFEHFAQQGEYQRANGRLLPTTAAERDNFSIDADMPLSTQIKATISVREFVSQFILLSTSGKGLCPFHHDHKPSFSVNDEENYWHCFACNIGGSIIDFWMYKQKCDFTTAVRQLAAKLLDTS